MLDASPLPRLQRARGRAEVAVSHRGGRIRLDRLVQEGCGKALMPRTHGPVPEVVLVNTSGGVTGGDRIDWRLAAGPGAALVATTQAAERIYRSSGGAGRIETRLALGAGAALDWLPQETILYEGGRLARTLDVEMAPDARLFAIETLVLGRAAMGERVATGLLSDQWRIRRGGRLVHAEAVHADGDLAAATAGPATLRAGRAFATIVLAAPGAADRLDAARALLGGDRSGGDRSGVETAATAKPDLLIVRFVAAEARPLRAALVHFLLGVRPEPLPRVWST
jgi:urease accessory protein